MAAPPGWMQTGTCPVQETVQLRPLLYEGQAPGVCRGAKPSEIAIKGRMPFWD